MLNSYDMQAFGETEPNTEWEANLTLAKPVPSWQDESPNRSRILTNEKPSNWPVYLGLAVSAALALYVVIAYIA